MATVDGEITANMNIFQLHKACEDGDIPAVIQLLVDGVHVDAPLICEPTIIFRGYKRPIHCACEHGRAEVVRVLLAAGARPTSRGAVLSEHTPLDLACEHRHIQVAKVLLQAGASADGPVWYDRNRLPADHAIRPLHTAAAGGHAELCQVLIEAGAQADAPGNEGLTALYLACWIAGDGAILEEHSLTEASFADVARVLLQAGANANARSADGRTPLHYATEKLCALLLSHGADIHAKSTDGETPLHAACDNTEGYIEVARQLLRAGADLEARDETLRTPLHRAIGRGELVGLLLSAGANVEAEDIEGQRPLHYACFLGDDVSNDGNEMERVVQQLLAAGAQVNARDKDGSTPLSFAMQSRDVGIIRKLVAAGAHASNPQDDAEASLLAVVQAWVAEGDAVERARQLFLATALEARQTRGRVRRSS